MTRSIPGNADVQDKVFAFLMNPSTHPSVRRIDTHAASVFLEGTRALKVKRAVRFPYLDYSTLVKRKAACDEEMKINRPFAPQIYRRVVPITRQLVRRAAVGCRHAQRCLLRRCEVVSRREGGTVFAIE